MEQRQEGPLTGQKGTYDDQGKNRESAGANQVYNPRGENGQNYAGRGGLEGAVPQGGRDGIGGLTLCGGENGGPEGGEDALQWLAGYDWYNNDVEKGDQAIRQNAYSMDTGIDKRGQGHLYNRCPDPTPGATLHFSALLYLCGKNPLSTYRINHEAGLAQGFFHFHLHFRK